jgi:hypothetical protein
MKLYRHPLNWEGCLLHCESSVRANVHSINSAIVVLLNHLIDRLGSHRRGVQKWLSAGIKRKKKLCVTRLMRVSSASGRTRVAIPVVGWTIVLKRMTRTRQAVQRLAAKAQPTCNSLSVLQGIPWISVQGMFVFGP